MHTRSEIVLIIPAAGAGTRLQTSTPKVLAPVNGKPMIDHLLARYRRAVSRFVLVLSPAFVQDVRAHVSTVAPDLDVDYALQERATGMLDAILLASPAADRPGHERVWVTWCDQIGIHPHTITTLARMSDEHPSAYAILPTTQQTPPYIHLERNAKGHISAVRQAREGDEMPATGESDMGLFSLSHEAYFHALPLFAREASAATATHERNFLPFLPWLVRHGHAVLTFPSTNPLEAIGVNTPDDSRRLEGYLRELDTL